ncbi:potassium-transporting ATPase subunit C [Gordonia sp. ABSL11-1]|uniref:potassium-transporting ATPase subunit C n=1 Tax=Gordonia sp. ABSL11-1 TaxID=3053924 RepID=UPI002573F8E9|nr:potassium-transporting ATPase subunit C [Gordonia sp. ABSL11-1]MDL9946415.1 potassium-transporting ATPase subunit C [Gordonia sp. ABSL11-1]
MNTVLSGFVRQCVAAVGVLLALTVVLGVVYPSAVWAVSRIGSGSAEGSQVRDARGCEVGSSLIGIDPQVPAGQPDPYLHARVIGSADDPMATGDPAASAASNKGPNNEDLLEWIEKRRSTIAVREGVAPSAVPTDAVTGSGSGLDPDISPEYAQLQVPRLARENQRPPAEIERIIDEHTSGRQLGFLGQPRVNVLEVNLALGHTAPSCPR